MATNVKCNVCDHEWISQALVGNIEDGKIQCKAEGCDNCELTIMDPTLTGGESQTKPTTAEEAKTLGVKESKVSVKRLAKGANEKEETKKHDIFVANRQKNRVEKAKAAVNTSPIQKRKATIKAKLKSAQRNAQKYPKNSLKNLLEELRIINNSPKVWNERTSKGTKPYPIIPAQKKTVMQEISEQDLD
jgi:hypothetical protein